MPGTTLKRYTENTVYTNWTTRNTLDRLYTVWVKEWDDRQGLVWDLEVLWLVARVTLPDGDDIWHTVCQIPPQDWHFLGLAQEAANAVE